MSEGEAMPVWPIENRQSHGIAGSRALGLCDRICPERNRHCDAYGAGTTRNYGHPGPHACPFCPDWRSRA